jgi:phosphoribosylformimino-5-aminoimidazole carboxamide ribotide isomerase
VEIVPVIDLIAGEVVHAQRGDRASYRPVRSQLCRSSSPLDVVGAFREVFPFTSFYIADLDAIQARGDNLATIRAIRERFPDLRLWVDSGLHDADACRDWLAQGLGELVIGSEAQRDSQVLRSLFNAGARHQLILSLDYKDGRFLGPTQLLNDRSPWPNRIIVMTLSRVGSRGGPDIELLRRWRSDAPDKEIFAAGGVRGGEDLMALADCGVSGVLVATALHEQRIGAAEIVAVSPAQAPI